MSDEQGEGSSAEAIARKLIAQCRSDIKAAWDALAAAREALALTRWLRARWEAERRATEAARARSDGSAEPTAGAHAHEDEVSAVTGRGSRRARRSRS
jgi:hypothetical protein